MKKVSFASLIMSDGFKTVFGQYHGKLRYRKGKPSFIRFNDAIEIKRTTVESCKGDYLALAKEIETKEFPAFDWSIKHLF